MAAVLTVVNNCAAVTNGLYRPRFTMNIRGLDTRKKTLNLESAQFELHYENVDPITNKLYVKAGESEEQLNLLTGTYTNIEELVSVINETLKKAKHSDIQFSYSRLSSRVSVSVPEGKTCTLKQDSPSLVLGIGEIATRHDITGSHYTVFPTAVNDDMLSALCSHGRSELNPPPRPSPPRAAVSVRQCRAPPGPSVCMNQGPVVHA